MSSEEQKKNLPVLAPKHDSTTVVDREERKEDDIPHQHERLSADEEARLKKQNFNHQQPSHHHQNINVKQANQHNTHGRDHGQNQIQSRGQNH